MIQNYIIGVDISKSKIDCAIMSTDYALIAENEVSNSDLKIASFLRNLIKKLKIEASDLLICCEATGIYCSPLKRVCEKLNITLWVEQAIKIKRATSNLRGKNDQLDAKRIADYAIRYYDRLIPFKEPSETVKLLNALIKARDTMVSQKLAIENHVREAQTHDSVLFKILNRAYKTSLNSLKKSILKIDLEIELHINKDEELKQSNELIQSIPGIGVQIAVNLIVATNNFKNFNSAKQLACYAGVVPFDNQSGTVIKKSRVSKMADKRIKRLLHMAAMSACVHDTELRGYFIRKVEMGKNKMSVLNAIRNKLVHRIMAVIQRQTPFIKSQEEYLKNKLLNTCF